MTTTDRSELVHRAILERRANVRIARLGRIVEALNRRRSTIERSISIGAAATVGGVVLLVTAMVLKALYVRHERRRSLTHRLAQWVDPYS